MTYSIQDNTVNVTLRYFLVYNVTDICYNSVKIISFFPSAKHFLVEIDNRRRIQEEVKPGFIYRVTHFTDRTREWSEF